MEQYEIRVNQLRRLKGSLLFRLFLILVLSIGIEVVMYFLIKSYTISILDIENYKNDSLFPILYFIFAGLIVLLINIIFVIQFNKKYRKFYLECIYSEAKLEEIYLLDHKVSNDKNILSFIEKIYFLDKVSFISSFSDASSKFSCDINIVRYKKNNRMMLGSLCLLHYDQEKPGFLQITHNTECALETYDGKDIIQYGMPITSILRKSRVFSTYGALTYILEKNEYGNKIVSLEKYFSSPIDIVFDNDNLYIFIPNYKIELSDNIFRHVSHTRFMEKIESIIRFHNLTFDLIKMFDDLFITIN